MQTILVQTGFGYYTDSNGHITSKASLPVGEHPLADGFVYTEVPDQATLDTIVVWQPTPTPLEAWDWSVFAAGLQVAFQPLTDYQDILVFYPMVIDYARLKNFTGMNTFLQGLITASLITQAHFNLLNSVAGQQGIDITNPPTS